jgi:hypothetical protein
MDLSSGKEDIVIAYLVLEEECARKQWGRGLIPGHVDGNYRLYQYYFARYHIFDSGIFRRRCSLSLVGLSMSCILK